MKKSLVFALILAFMLSLTLTASAEECCPYHPDAGTWEKAATWHMGENEEGHLYVEFVDRVCRDCEHIVYSISMTEYTVPHSFGPDNTCDCGYVRPASEIPTSEQLMDAAKKLGDRAIGSTALILHGGNMRESASALSETIGTVNVDETYTILDIAQDSKGDIWFQIACGNQDVWIYAGLADVLPVGSTEGGERPDLVGHWIVVKYRTGYTRVAPGTGSKRSESVYADEKYIIQDCALDSAGNLWYLINVKSVDCWIHSGIVNVLSDEITTAGDREVPGSERYIGRQAVVKYKTGYTRVAPGSASDRAGSVYEGERYMIYDCAYDSEDNLWYQIKVDSVDCWIASGIVDLQ